MHAHTLDLAAFQPPSPKVPSALWPCSSLQYCSSSHAEKSHSVHLRKSVHVCVCYPVCFASTFKPKVSIWPYRTALFSFFFFSHQPLIVCKKKWLQCFTNDGWNGNGNTQRTLLNTSTPLILGINPLGIWKHNSGSPPHLFRNTVKRNVTSTSETTNQKFWHLQRLNLLFTWGKKEKNSTAKDWPLLKQVYSDIGHD